MPSTATFASDELEAETETDLTATRHESPSRRTVASVVFDVKGQQEAIDTIVSAVHARSARVFAFCNVHTFNLANRLPAFAQALAQTTVFNDGLGMDVASRLIYGKPFPNNLNGTDLTPAVLGSLQRPTSVFLVGSVPGVAEKAAAALEQRFPMVSVVGTSDGYFEADESAALVERIQACGTDLLLLGMGNPRQELWAVEIASRSGAVIMCVGAYLDFVSGRIRRAPRLVRRVRMEWLFRLVLEPTRLWSRYVGGALPFFRAVFAERARRSALDIHIA